MTNKELIEKLKTLPMDLEVMYEYFDIEDAQVVEDYWNEGEYYIMIN
ncbi:MAG: hypothetical protein IJS58_08195 [Bacilli bacterium]|nr:hypothetical protein [Bacilli bacterium]